MKIWSITKNCYKCLHTIDDVNEYSFVGLADNKLLSTNGLDEVIIRVLNEPYKDIPMKSIAFSFGDYVYIRKKCNDFSWRKTFFALYLWKRIKYYFILKLVIIIMDSIIS